MPKFTILLVDDEQDFLKIMSLHMEGMGYDVIAASSGKEALEIVRAKGVDIIILDYIMPNMDGISTLSQIRKLGIEAPVIMFTAYPDERSIKGAENLGVLAYIPKISGHSDVQASLKSALHMAQNYLEEGK
ncbi:MAG: response regulator [Candidatus Omnitrophica bacterium]|nr:response regulator [Candidatus Omnitrophota bacterium]